MEARWAKSPNNLKMFMTFFDCVWEELYMNVGRFILIWIELLSGWEGLKSKNELASRGERERLGIRDATTRKPWTWMTGNSISFLILLRWFYSTWNDLDFFQLLMSLANSNIQNLLVVLTFLPMDQLAALRLKLVSTSTCPSFQCHNLDQSIRPFSLSHSDRKGLGLNIYRWSRAFRFCIPCRHLLSTPVYRAFLSNPRSFIWEPDSYVGAWDGQKMKMSLLNED